MDYLKALRDDPDLAEEFDSLFDFFLLDELSPRDEADEMCIRDSLLHPPVLPRRG